MMVRSVEQNYNNLTEIRNALKKYAQLVKTAKALTVGTKMEDDVTSIDYLIDFQTHIICNQIDKVNTELRW